MQRPVMNPMLASDDTFEEVDARRSFLRRLAGGVASFMGFVGWMLLIDLRPWKRLSAPKRGASPSQVSGDVESQVLVLGAKPAGALAVAGRWVVSRAAGAMVVLVIAVMALVYAGTRPVETRASNDPGMLGLYVETVKVKASDGQMSAMWVVPVLDASRVLREGETAVKSKWPVVLLVPDDSAQRSQMLPLIKPLHDAGAIVAVLAPRGRETATPGSVTFGLSESSDVVAAVNYLRSRNDVAGDRITLGGVGTGATAVVLAADKVAAHSLVLVNPPEDASSVIRQRVTPRQAWLGWMNTLCKWGFELSYGLDADDISVVRHPDVITRPTTAVIPWRGSTAELSPVVTGHMYAFLAKNVGQAHSPQVFTAPVPPPETMTTTVR